MKHEVNTLFDLNMFQNHSFFPLCKPLAAGTLFIRKNDRKRITLWLAEHMCVCVKAIFTLQKEQIISLEGHSHVKEKRKKE